MLKKHLINAAAVALLTFLSTAISASEKDLIVRLDTSAGIIDIKLFPEKPL